MAKAPVEDLCCGAGGGKNVLSPGPAVTEAATCKDHSNLGVSITEGAGEQVACRNEQAVQSGR